MSKPSPILWVSPVTAFRRSLATEWSCEDAQKRAEKLRNDVGGVVIALFGFVGAVIAGEALAGAVLGGSVVILTALWQHHNLFADAWRGIPEARRRLKAEKLRPYVEACERDLARYRAEETRREWETRYGVPFVTFEPLSPDLHKDVRTAMERLRVPFEQAGGQAAHLLTFHGNRIMHEHKDGRPWGKWIGPQIVAQADKLKAAWQLFDQALKNDADPRSTFYTLHVCYRKSRRFVDQVAEIWPDAHSGDMYTRLVQYDEALKDRLQETLAPKEFNEIKERLKEVLSDIGF